MPVVSVIIPTWNRPITVLRAVRDALRQTLTDIEVIVVIDGENPETELCLKAISDPRLRVVQHSANRGLSEARNTGIRESTGKWIALLDDDDEWYPEKLQKQVAAGDAVSGTHVFVISRYLEITSRYVNTRPEVMPLPSDTGKQFTEYLYCRRGLIAPVSFLVSRDLALEVPFDTTLQPAEDNDFSIRCMARPKTKLVAVDEVLAVYNNKTIPSTGPENAQYRLSRSGNWIHILSWALRQKHLFTSASFACLLSRSIAQYANDQGASLREKLTLLQIALWMGEFSPRILLHCLASSFLSRETKHWLRRKLFSSARRHSMSTVDAPTRPPR